jgi:hypothetical protein
MLLGGFGLCVIQEGGQCFVLRSSIGSSSSNVTLGGNSTGGYGGVSGRSDGLHRPVPLAVRRVLSGPGVGAADACSASPPALRLLSCCAPCALRGPIKLSGCVNGHSERV